MTNNNTRFRPSDWIERIALCSSIYSEQNTLKIQSKLMPVYNKNEKYLRIDLSLKDSNPALWDFVMNFISSNNLKTVEEI